MFERTMLLQKLFDEYDIENLTFGTKQDKLGDVMEEYCTRLLNWKHMFRKLKYNDFDMNNLDDYLYISLIEKMGIDIGNVESITADRHIEHRHTGGNSKTDVLATIKYPNKEIEVPISVKQTTVQKVAMAEFDAQTIFDEVGITDPVVIRLITKHQVDASAINFTAEEKVLLTTHLRPYARSLVRWVLSGTSNASNDLRFPKIIVKFAMSRDDEINDVNIFDIESYVDSVMHNKNGTIKSGGFGTGLSWTYATGSKGRKIQFKG